MAKQEKHPDFDKLDSLISQALLKEKQPDLPADFSLKVMQKIAEAEKSEWQYKPLIGKKSWGVIICILLTSALLTYFSNSSAESSSITEGLNKILIPVKELSFGWLSVFNQSALAFSVLSICSIMLIYFYMLTRKTTFNLEL